VEFFIVFVIACGGARAKSVLTLPHTTLNRGGGGVGGIAVFIEKETVQHNSLIKRDSLSRIIKSTCFDF
jgi:hypothetical protein